MRTCNSLAVMDCFLHLLIPFLLWISHQGGELVGAADYNDTISCEDFPSVGNTNFEQEQEAMRLGQCIPYIESDRPNPCDEFYTIGVDMVYLPNGRALDSLPTINEFVSDVTLVVEILPAKCRDQAVRAICYYYYPPCGNITQFEPPNALCQDACLYLTTELCQQEWLLALQHLASLEDFLEEFQLQFLNCSNPGSPLGNLPHCCSDAGITRPPGTTETGSTFSTTFSPPNSNSAVLAASVSTVVAVLLLLLV